MLNSKNKNAVSWLYIGLSTQIWQSGHLQHAKSIRLHLCSRCGSFSSEKNHDHFCSEKFMNIFVQKKICRVQLHDITLRLTYLGLSIGISNLKVVAEGVAFASDVIQAAMQQSRYRWRRACVPHGCASLCWCWQATTTVTTSGWMTTCHHCHYVGLAEMIEANQRTYISPRHPGVKVGKNHRWNSSLYYASNAFIWVAYFS